MQLWSEVAALYHIVKGFLVWNLDHLAKQEV
jgi:hypothetical protein